jgi:hypothetical protein
MCLCVTGVTCAPMLLVQTSTGSGTNPATATAQRCVLLLANVLQQYNWSRFVCIGLFVSLYALGFALQ